MQYRILGKTGLKVSEIGFGAWGIGGGMWGNTDDEEATKALRRAFDLGINFFDTARVYGDAKNRDGHSEKLIGEFLKEIGRDKVYVASKVPPKNYEWPARSDVVISEVFPKDWIVQKVGESLKALRVETIDLMQFHVWQDSYVENDDWKEAVQDLTKQGKVKHWGISINDYQPANVLRTLETGLIDTVQFIFNIYHQDPEKELLPFAKKNKIGLVARVPLDEGGLTGAVTPETVFGDWRDGFFKGDRRKEVFERAKALLTVAGGEVQSLPEMALRWILSHDEVSTVIPGMRKASHVSENTRVPDGRKLSAPLMSKLVGHAWERNFYQ